MANKVKSITLPKGVNKKDKKAQYVLTIESLLKPGFHFGGDESSAHKDMNPFIVGKSKAHSRFKTTEKKSANDPQTKKALSQKLGVKFKNRRNKVAFTGLKQKNLSYQLARLNEE